MVQLPTPTAVVYYKPGCPFGIRLRGQLLLHRVAFRAVAFGDDPDGAAQVRAVNDGNELSPTVRVGDVWLSNPPWREVRAMLVTATHPDGRGRAARRWSRHVPEVETLDSRHRSSSPTASS